MYFTFSKEGIEINRVKCGQCREVFFIYHRYVITTWTVVFMLFELTNNKGGGQGHFALPSALKKKKKEIK